MPYTRALGDAKKLAVLLLTDIYREGGMTAEEYRDTVDAIHKANKARFIGILVQLSQRYSAFTEKLPEILRVLEKPAYRELAEKVIDIINDYSSCEDKIERIRRVAQRYL